MTSRWNGELDKVESQEAFVRRFTLRNKAKLINDANKCGFHYDVSWSFVKILKRSENSEKILKNFKYQQSKNWIN